MSSSIDYKNKRKESEIKVYDVAQILRLDFYLICVGWYRRLRAKKW
jgi:hypothetical protein